MRRALALLFFFACVTLHAQKARPVAIPLKDGEGMAQGQLKGRQEMEYEVQASGHTLTVALTATPIRTLSVKVFDPDDMEMTVQRVGAGRWTVTLPKPGVYGITVVRAASSPGISRYRLSVNLH